MSNIYFEELLSRNFEEDLITNFENSELTIYEKAINEYKDSNLYISNVAYDYMGRELDNCKALRCKTRYNLSKFWRIFDRIKEEEKIKDNMGMYI